MIKKMKAMNKPLKLYFLIIALTAFALTLCGGEVLSNFFKDAYNITAFQRGLIEFPRELPGVMVLLIISSLTFLSDIRISMIAQVLSIIGILVLGFFTPSFNVMLLFIFINSVGMHMFFPLQDGIGMSMIKGDDVGKRMGQYRGVSTAFAMFGGILVFVGFRAGIFSFTTPFKWIFVVSGFILVIVLFLFFKLEHAIQEPIRTNKKFKIIFRKEYKYYYTLVVLFGVQKQMLFVYAPWVLIELLGKKMDTLAILAIAGSFVGVFFIPLVGRLLDRFGVKSILYADAISFIVVYILYGILITAITSNKLAVSALTVGLTYLLYIIDRMSNQLGMVRTIYLREIAVESTDITSTLSVGVSMDHVVSILCAILAGVIWGQWGPQYIFFLAAGISLINLYVATKVTIKKVA